MYTSKNLNNNSNRSKNFNNILKNLAKATTSVATTTYVATTTTAAGKKMFPSAVKQCVTSI